MAVSGHRSPPFLIDNHKWQWHTRWNWDTREEDQICFTVDRLFLGTGDGRTGIFVTYWFTPAGGRMTASRRSERRYSTANNAIYHANEAMRRLFKEGYIPPRETSHTRQTGSRHVLAAAI